MKLDTSAFAYSAAIAAAIAWTICSAIVALLPGPTMALTASMFHVTATSVAWSLTWGSFLVGLCAWAIVSALFAALWAGLNNRFVKP